MHSLDIDRLASAIAERTSTEVHVDSDEREAFELLVTEAETHACLSDTGRRLLQADLMRCLTHKSAMEREPLGAWEKEPIVLAVVGMPRSGSTLLHYLLADTGAFAFVPLWQAFEPATDDSKFDVARSNVGRYLTLLDSLSPDLRSLHPMEVDGPEECIALMALNGVSERWAISLRVPRYLQFCRSADRTHTYKKYRRHLERLLKKPSHVLIKAPTHTGHLHALHEAFPRLHVVSLNRPFNEVFASYERLIVSARRVFSDKPQVMEKEWEEYWRTSLSAERNFNGPPVMRLGYDEIVEDPLGATERILSWCGMNVDLSGLAIRTKPSPRR